MTKPQTKGWREKLAQWADSAVDWMAGLLPVAPEPVPVRIPPRRPQDTNRR